MSSSPGRAAGRSAGGRQSCLTTATSATWLDGKRAHVAPARWGHTACQVGGAARETTPLPPTSLQTPLTHVADEVAGTVGLPSDHAQGLGHHEAVLRGGRQAGSLSEGLPAPPAAPGADNRRRRPDPQGAGSGRRGCRSSGKPRAAGRDKGRLGRRRQGRPSLHTRRADRRREWPAHRGGGGWRWRWEASSSTSARGARARGGSRDE